MDLLEAYARAHGMKAGQALGLLSARALGVDPQDRASWEASLAAYIRSAASQGRTLNKRQAALELATPALQEWEAEQRAAPEEPATQAPVADEQPPVAAQPGAPLPCDLTPEQTAAITALAEASGKTCEAVIRDLLSSALATYTPLTPEEEKQIKGRFFHFFSDSLTSPEGRARYQNTRNPGALEAWITTDRPVSIAELRSRLSGRHKNGRGKHRIEVIGIRANRERE